MRPPTAFLKPIVPLSLQFPMSRLYISAMLRPEGGEARQVSNPADSDKQQSRSQLWQLDFYFAEQFFKPTKVALL